MEKENELHLKKKNDGLQLVIQSNTGTITIHNHVNDNTRAIDSNRENEREQNKIIDDFLKTVREITKDFIEMEKQKNQSNNKMKHKK